MDSIVREKLRAFVAERIPENRSRPSFDDSDSLFLSGQLSSFNAIELIMFMECEFGVDLSGTDFDQMQLDTIASIMELVVSCGDPSLLTVRNQAGASLP
jgi:acyl carrier protein